MRLALAIVVSTVSVVLMYFVLSLVSGELPNDLWVPTALVALIIGAVGVTVVGLPVHFLLGLVHKRRASLYALAGFVAPVLVVLVARPFGEDGPLWVLWQALLLGMFGVCVALLFWKLAVGSNPHAHS